MARDKIDYSRIRLPVALTLYGAQGGYLGDVTRKLAASWRRSIRAVGGCWIGSASWEGTSAEMLDVFQNGMQYEIRESFGGMVTWEGFLAEMELIYHGQRYTRSWSALANRIKAEYSRVGVNLVTNTGCEAAVWDAYNTPPVRERSSAWASEGLYSGHITADAANDGVVIAASMAITAGRAYQGRLTVNVVSGVWRVELFDAGTGAVLDSSDQNTAGASVVYIGFDETAYTVAANIGMRLYSVDASGECYADAAVFQETPTRGETAWLGDAISQAEYGVIEDVLMLAGETDATALAKTQRELRDRAWARTRPPTGYTLSDADDRLNLTFCGYAFTLRNRMTLLAGMETYCGALVLATVQASQYIQPGAIQANNMLYRIEERSGYRAWDVLADITRAGDAAYNRWACGVYPGRRLNYQVVDTAPAARIKRGRVLSPAGGFLEPWLARPGYVAVDDLPRVYDIPEQYDAASSRLAWFDEVEFSLPAYVETDGGGIVYRTGTV